MDVEDLTLVSVDDHIVEPPGFLEPHLPAKYRDVAPKLEHRPDGTDYWEYDGRHLPNVGLNAVVGRPQEEYGIEPTSFAEMRAGCYDIGERVKDITPTECDFGDRLPSQVFRERFITCFIDDPVGVTLRRDVGLRRSP